MARPPAYARACLAVGHHATSWLKIKCAKPEAFPIVGFVPGVGGIEALRLGRREGDQLLYGAVITWRAGRR
jgi:ATP-dependent DNA ligase